MFADPMKIFLLLGLVLFLIACEKNGEGTLLDDHQWVANRLMVDGHDSTDAMTSGTCDGGPWTFTDSGVVFYYYESHPCIAGGAYSLEENNKILRINMGSSGFGGSVGAYKVDGEVRWHILLLSREYLILSTEYNGRHNELWFRRTG
jgi:hypothetical protein